MGYSSTYKKGQRQFVYHLAEDAITNWLNDKPHTAAFIAEATENYERFVTAANERSGGTEEWSKEDQEANVGWLDYLTAIANSIVDEVLAATGDKFRGDARGNYGCLVAAAYDTVGIEN